MMSMPEETGGSMERLARGRVWRVILSFINHCHTERVSTGSGVLIPSDDFAVFYNTWSFMKLSIQRGMQCLQPSLP